MTTHAAGNATPWLVIVAAGAVSESPTQIDAALGTPLPPGNYWAALNQTDRLNGLASTSPWTPEVPFSIAEPALVTTSTIAYMLVPGKDTYGAIIVGSVPLGAPCVAAEPVLTYFVVPVASITFTTGLKSPVVVATCH